ncbi:MAG: hypothetical protein ACJ789_05130 [Thermomicrobiales bacterium]
MAETAPIARRRYFADKFQTQAEKTEYFSDLAKKSQAGRIVLTGDQADAVRQAYALLQRVSAKLEAPVEVGDD